MRINAIIPFLTFIPSIIAICDFITQQPNQYCHDLAQRCKISDDDFFKFNKNIQKDCSNLSPGQRVCCNTGGLTPSPDKDGRCYVYEVKPGDDCGKIGGLYGLTPSDINNYNNRGTTTFHGTWGFRGCQNLQPGRICVSEGDKGPIPALQKDAQGNPVVCGPTASGNGTNVKCPLNSCCNEWGQCGLTPDFCDIVPDINPGVKGCQDNCGMEYKTNAPSGNNIKIGYYESWNGNWPCGNMDINQLILAINKEKYTHIHYAFGVISDYNAVVNDTETWQKFLKINDVKKVLSFGGWAFSTEDATRPIFGDAVLNKKFAESVVDMVNKYNLDGIDIDWEYPGATDLKGWAGSTPTVHDNDGENYLNFIKLLKPMMPKGKTLSIAAPASYWYLKNFPIKEMSEYLDYIVYMTYDLHGQWDYNIKSTGAWLLSHVNKTETIDALTMIITKAGVPNNKVIMGTASYGRSFWQADPNCYGPTCKFTDHGATPGKCTDTSGYISYEEIQNIIDNGTVRKMYYDDKSDSDILMYNTNDWVAYTNLSTTIKHRYDMVDKMKLGGTVEWAVDLRGSSIVDINDPDIELLLYTKEYTIEVEYKKCPTNIESLNDIDSLDPYCIDYGLTQVLYHNLTNAIKDYEDMMSDDYFYLYSKKYLPYAKSSSDNQQIVFWDSATVKDKTYSSSFDKYIQCKDSCTKGGSVELKKDVKIDDISKAFYDSMGGVFAYKYDTFKFPYTYDDYNVDKYKIVYEHFPIIDKDNSFPDPSKNISDKKDAIDAMSKMLTDAYNNPDNYNHEDVVDAVMYNIISLENAVEAMKNIVEIGNKIIEEEEKEAAKFILNIIVSLIEVFIAFVPVVGPILSTTIGVIYDAATGEGNGATYAFAAAGAIGDIYDLFKVGKSFNDIATLSRKLKVGDKIKSLRHMDMNDIRIRNINNVRKTASTCMI